ncbi:response regulator transcription factor [Shimia sp. R11_0]|uniref:LuxR C-terminal-related transcriptional regulator n=1 Tax=Shimia sp. R11_0 TaxID=2821096 RepID=UPI001ADBC556|nr:response regulator transcription factor [Shimia sp. R11_0]
MKILIADDHDLLRDTLVAFVEASGEASTVAVSDLEGVIGALDVHGGFDLVLLDYNMPGMQGLEGLTRAMAHVSAPRVALMSGEAPRDVVHRAMGLGAAGFVPKTLPAKSLVNAVRFMAAGEQFVPAEFLNDTGEDRAAHPIAQKLTKREMQVLKGLAEGKANKEIARDLNLSEPTIKLHVKNLYRKIGAANRTQAALIAREAALF